MVLKLKSGMFDVFPTRIILFFNFLCNLNVYRPIHIRLSVYSLLILYYIIVHILPLTIQCASNIRSSSEILFKGWELAMILSSICTWLVFICLCSVMYTRCLYLVTTLAWFETTYSACICVVYTVYHVYQISPTFELLVTTQQIFSTFSCLTFM